MDATQNAPRAIPTDLSDLTELDWWLRTCDNSDCHQVVTRPMGTTCGHLFCSPCLIARGVVTTSPLSCPSCNAPLSESAMENMPTTRSPAILLNHVPTRMRIEYYQLVVEKWKVLNGENRVQLLSNLSEFTGRRIEQLEERLDSMMEMNSELLTEIDVRDATINDMSEQIEELEQRVNFTNSVSTELLREMMNMRRNMSARILQLEIDAARRARIAPEPETLDLSTMMEEY